MCPWRWNLSSIKHENSPSESSRSLTILNLSKIGWPLQMLSRKCCQLEHLNKRFLSTGEPCTCGYVTFRQSFHIGTLSICWCLAPNFISVLLRRSFKAAMMSRFLKVAMATPHSMNKTHKGRIAFMSLGFQL